MCWLCKAVDHVFDSLEPYLDSSTLFKRYTYKKKLHGNTSRKKTQESKRTLSTGVKGGKQQIGRYVQNKQVELSRSIDENKKNNVRLKINKQYNVYDHIYHKNKLRRTSSMPVYTSRPQIVQRKILAIEGLRVKGISRSAKDLRSRSSERSLARRSLKRSRSEGANVDKSGIINRKNMQISRKVKEQHRRAYSRSPSRAIRRRHHSHDETVHRGRQRNLKSSRPSGLKLGKERPPSERGPQSARSVKGGPESPSRERSLNRLSMKRERAMKNRNAPQKTSRKRSRNYSNPVTNSENVNLKSSLKNKNYESEEREMIHRSSIYHAERGSDLRYSANRQQHSESSEESKEEANYEEEYEEDCEERSEETSASWYDRMEDIKIRRDIRQEYFRMMEELFILSGDGIHSKISLFIFLAYVEKEELGSSSPF